MADHEPACEFDNEREIDNIYSAQSPLRHPIAMFQAMCRDLIASRGLAWRLFLRDIQTQYRQSILGYLWILLPPLATTLIWVFLNSQGVLNFGSTDIPYPAYVLTGMLIWEAFVSALHAPQSMVRGAAAIMSKINFPHEALLLAGAGKVIFTTCVRMLLLIGVFVWFELPVPPTIVAAPLALLAVILLGLMIGVVLVPLGMLYQDIGQGLAVLTGLWFILTPIVYPPPTAWPASLLASWNPLGPPLITAREMMTTGQLSCLGEFLVVIAVTVVCLLVGWILYRLSIPHLIVRMGA